MKKAILKTTVIFAFIFCVSSCIAQSGKVAIILQENTGKLSFLNSAPRQLREATSLVADFAAETFETFKSKYQASAYYEKMHDLTDINCRIDTLLSCLIAETKRGKQIDLYFFGHGNSQGWYLFNNQVLGGQSILKLLSDAKLKTKNVNFQFNLNLVYTCACYGGVQNANWLAINAKVTVGTKCNNFFPEPMITDFMRNYLNNNQTVDAAATNAYRTLDMLFNNPIFLAAFEKDICNGNKTIFEQSRPFVEGNKFLKFSPNAVSVNPILSSVLPSGKYSIRCFKGGLNLGVTGSCWATNNNDPCAVVLWTPSLNSANNNMTYIIEPTLGNYTIKSNNKFLGSAAANLVFDNWSMLDVARNGGINGVAYPNRAWNVIHVRDNLYKIKHSVSGKYMDAHNDHTSNNGCEVMLYDGHNGNNQLWIIDPVF